MHGLASLSCSGKHLVTYVIARNAIRFTKDAGKKRAAVRRTAAHPLDSFACDYFTRTASARISGVPEGPSAATWVAAPVLRFTRYSTDCAEPVG